MKIVPSLALATLTLIVTSAVNANETYACLFGGNERTVRVSYANADSKVPCQVIYEKESGSQVLWDAQNEEGYCEMKAAEFVEKQRGWGWDCAKMEAAAEVTPIPASTVTTPAS
jgi:hypothetical protein